MSTQEKGRLASPTAGPGASSEVPEPDEAVKKEAAEMMHAYDSDKPTLVMPGSGGAVSGTAVGDWLDENGDPKYGKDGPAGDAKAAHDATEDGTPEYMSDEMIASDKECNEEVLKEVKARARKEQDAANDDKAARK